MKITLDVRQSVEENAQRFFAAAKKARRKEKGAEKALLSWQKRPERKERPVVKKERRQRRKREWFEKFRWSFSSDGFLMVGGRDATTNEVLIKKYAEKGDLVFHTDMAGSPFVVVKAGGKEVPFATIEEAAQFCVSFSRAWRNGMTALEAFYVAPEQVTKEARAGEFLGKGAFLIRGKTTYVKVPVRVAVGIDTEGRVVAGPPRAVLKQCGRAYEVLQGQEKTSLVAKELYKLLEGAARGLTIDDFVVALPSGGMKLGRQIERAS